MKGVIMPAKISHFGPELFKFIRELRKNNNRDWFKENKARYEQDVREPLLRFISDFGPHLRKISSSFVADPRPVGGSMFRIYRDVRFSNDKTPYKTHASAQFRHKMGKDVHAPGFYLHLEPGDIFGAAGLWRPDSASLAKIRNEIVDNPAKWKRAVGGKKFKAMCTLVGDTLVRGPKDFDPDHPLIEDIKRKDFICVAGFTAKEATSADFIKLYYESCRAAAPLVRFLTKAVELEW